MVADFSHLKKYDVQGAKLARYEFTELDGQPWVEGVFAGDTNKPYQNALIKRGQKNAKRWRAQKASSKELDDNREDDRQMFPKYVLKRWGNMVDSSGKPVPFSEEDCEAFLRALPNYMFDDMRIFFQTPSSFIDDDEDEPVSVEDATELGNSSAPVSGGSAATSGTGGR